MSTAMSELVFLGADLHSYDWVILVTHAAGCLATCTGVIGATLPLVIPSTATLNVFTTVITRLTAVSLRLGTVQVKADVTGV